MSEDIQALNDEEIVRQYIQFKAIPDNDGKEDSFFCSRYGIGLDRLLRIKKATVNWAETALELRRKDYTAMTKEIDQALFDKAKAGDPRSVELWYKRFDQWDPKAQSKHYETFTDIIKAAYEDDHQRAGDVPGEEVPAGSVVLPEEGVGGQSLAEAD